MNDNQKKCNHCSSIISKSEPALCKKCSKLSKCTICEIIMCDLKGHVAKVSESNKMRCIDCEFFETRIKNICCGCEKEIPNSIQNYIRNGNMCYRCILEVGQELRLKQHD
jgi:hypothetical protein